MRVIQAKGRVLAVLLAGVAAAAAENEWHQWRGPAGQGVSEKAEVPTGFGPEKHFAWSVAMPGRGCSTPMVWDGMVVVTAALDGQDGVLAVDLEGKELWKKTLGEGLKFKHPSAGSSCNPSPLTDGERIFVYFKTGTLAALDREGKVIWQKNLQKEYAKDGLKWDLGTSPVMAGGHLVVAMMHKGNPSFLLAFDPATGDEVWKTEREYDAPQEANDAYTTPLVMDVDGVETIICWGADHLTGHNAKDGKLLWQHGDFNPRNQRNWRVIASPAVTGSIALVPFGRGDFVAGVELGGSGDTTESKRLWTRKGPGSDSATPAAADGKFYLLQDKGPKRGTVFCLDPKTGKSVWETRLPKSAAIYYASPLVAGDKLIAARSDGAVFCGRITPEGLVDVETTELEEPIVASPVAVGKKLLVRTHDHLWCFE